PGPSYSRPTPRKSAPQADEANRLQKGENRSENTARSPCPDACAATPTPAKLTRVIWPGTPTSRSAPSRSEATVSDARRWRRHIVERPQEFNSSDGLAQLTAPKLTPSDLNSFRIGPLLENWPAIRW